MKTKSLLSTLALAAALSPMGNAMADTKNYIHVVGSTTVVPFAEDVSAKLGKKLKHPLFESTGTNAGIVLFCEGGGLESPDVVNTSRSIRKSEFDICQNNGAGDLIEIKIGYDGIVIASGKKAKPMDLTRKELYLALAKKVPDPAACAGKPNCDTLIVNPYKTWKQINPALPDTKIEVFGPPLGSGTMEVFADAVTEAGCNTYPALAAKKNWNEKEYRRICDNVREDGVYTEETAETVVDRIVDNPNAIGILNFSRLKEHAAKLQAAKLDGVAPDYDSISSKTYPVAHPLFVYAKKSHVAKIPGLGAYLNEFASEKAIGPKGYLVNKGLIALPATEFKQVAADTKALKPMIIDIDHKP